MSKLYLETIFNFLILSGSHSYLSLFNSNTKFLSVELKYDVVSLVGIIIFLFYVMINMQRKTAYNKKGTLNIRMLSVAHNCASPKSLLS